MSSRFCITSFGAKSGGESLATKSIQHCINAAAEQGGGIVVIPPGVWLTGTLYLHSHIWLEITEGAVLLGSPNLADYPVQYPAYRSFHDANGFRALIYAEKAENIGLSGGGNIDGQGGCFPFICDEHDARPRLLQFVSCRNVTVRDLKLRNSAMWMQHYLNCDQVQVRNLNIWNHCNHNNDMIDVDGSRNVVVSDCVSDSDDDGLTLKSTGRAPTENVFISDCVISSRCNAIKCGSESTGGFRNIVISNCTIQPSTATSGIYGHPEGISAVSLQIVDGGIMDDITISRLTVKGTRSPLFLRLADRGRTHIADAPRPRLGTMRNIRLQDITAVGAGAIGSSITGVPGACIENVVLARVAINNCVVPPNNPELTLPPELAQTYPEATMFGPLPAFGMFVRHARNITFHDVAFTAAPEDRRPAVAISDSEGVVTPGLKPFVFSPPTTAVPTHLMDGR